MASLPFTAATYRGPRRAGPGRRWAAAALCLLCLLAARAAGRLPGAAGCGTTVGALEAVLAGSIRNDVRAARSEAASGQAAGRIRGVTPAALVALRLQARRVAHAE